MVEKDGMAVCNFDIGAAFSTNTYEPHAQAHAHAHAHTHANAYAHT